MKVKRDWVGHSLSIRVIAVWLPFYQMESVPMYLTFGLERHRYFTCPSKYLRYVPAYDTYLHAEFGSGHFSKLPMTPTSGETKGAIQIDVRFDIRPSPTDLISHDIRLNWTDLMP